jgi:hypothetical protein
VAIGDSYKTNFDTILAAAENKDLCLLEVYDRLTGEPAVMLCAGFEDENGEANLVPLAQMCAFNPYEKYVTEAEDVAKYRSAAKAIVRIADNSYVDLVNGIPNLDENPARAFGLLRDHLGDPARALHLAPAFAVEVLSKLKDEWSISARELDGWVAHAENGKNGDNDDAA